MHRLCKTTRPDCVPCRSASLRKPRAYLQKAVTGASKELADRVSVHLNTCNQHLERSANPVQESGRALRLCGFADECGRLRHRPRTSGKALQAGPEGRLRSLRSGRARLPDRPSGRFAAPSGCGHPGQCGPCAFRRGTIPTSRTWRKIPALPSCSIPIQGLSSPPEPATPEDDG